MIKNNNSWTEMQTEGRGQRGLPRIRGTDHVQASEMKDHLHKISPVL